MLHRIVFNYSNSNLFATIFSIFIASLLALQNWKRLWKHTHKPPVSAQSLHEYFTKLGKGLGNGSKRRHTHVGSKLLCLTSVRRTEISQTSGIAKNSLIMGHLVTFTYPLIIAGIGT